DMLEKKGSEDLLSYPTDLQKFIIEKHPNCIDIHLILNHYYDFDISMQEKIKKYFMESNHDLTNFDGDMPKEILFEVVKSRKLNKDEKIERITPFIKLFNRDETITYLEYLGVHEVTDVIKRRNRWRQIRTSEIPSKFLKYYEDKNWISVAKELKKDSTYTRVYGS